ncbi:MAG: membrane-bound lytic murein transglycosylase MltF [Parvibaculum sp.]|uniref:membrane-bound lytic murein transglycosylase MltF n=1 Tax=Parvibaculum sp. TaxID=2024848 RepID=UPI0028441D03|nr:membrane-bound lytic murein transglycosylase MltF [Parvibaculum sp.]MDR3499506.1 membrane-bound lytic murein transglycosylase MltF [Parvibaculum sp.]
MRKFRHALHVFDPPWRNRRMPYLVVLALLAFAAGNLIWYMNYERPVAQGLDAIRSSGHLVVLTRVAPTTYYLGADGQTGYEYVLTQELGKALGVDVEYRVYRTEAEITAALAASKGQIAAAGLVATDERREKFLIGPGYQPVRELVVCNRDIKLPKTPKDLAGLKLAVSEGTAGGDAALALVGEVDGLFVGPTREPVEKLLEVVASGRLDCTVANTLELQVNNPYYPQLVEAFPLTGEEPLAWLMAPGSEDLAKFLKTWMAGMSKSGALGDIAKRFFGFLPAFDYVDVSAFQDAIVDTLPDYEKAMRDAARETGLPWQVIAAVAYQESHWDPDATSHTGVRGIMMLTEDTAGHLGGVDRLDPIESIYAGARYIADLKSRLPEGVVEPDRLWFALAAYNMGFAHLMDARLLAERQGLDKNRWSSMRRVLPMLQQPEHADSLKYGPARSGQALRFVQQVRAYQHILEAIR